jgi:hypothetical protein
MKTLVIHPKDFTTSFLSEIYSDKDWTVITEDVSKKFLKEQIKSHDKIVMLGHGTEQGLLGFNKFIIDSNFVYLLRDKSCVCIWCNANIFVEKYGLKGFHTGMIISEYEEAIMCGIFTDLFLLEESNKDFAIAIKNSIDEKDMLEKAKLLYEGNTSVVEFNRSNLYFI